MAGLDSPSAVPITIPSTSPIAQPVRQCSVAVNATVQRAVGWCVQRVLHTSHYTPQGYKAPGRPGSSAGASGDVSKRQGGVVRLDSTTGGSQPDSDRIEGKTKQVEGELQETWGEVKDKARDAKEELEDVLDRDDDVDAGP